MTAKHDGSPTWGEVYWGWKQRGFPPEEAAHQADEAMRRQERERSGVTGRLNRAMRRKMTKEPTHD